MCAWEGGGHNVFGRAFGLPPPSIPPPIFFQSLYRYDTPFFKSPHVFNPDSVNLKHTFWSGPHRTTREDHWLHAMTFELINYMPYLHVKYWPIKELLLW